MSDNDNQAPTGVPCGADEVRANTKKTDGAEMNARPVADRLKAQGDAMAKKHGG